MRKGIGKCQDISGKHSKDKREGVIENGSQSKKKERRKCKGAKIKTQGGRAYSEFLS